MKRTESGEMPTVAVPREQLAPASASSIEGALQGYLAQIEEDRPTLVPCPRCAACAACLGTHMVTPAFSAVLKQEAQR